MPERRQIVDGLRIGVLLLRTSGAFWFLPNCKLSQIESGCSAAW